jgi:hypothetical protein
MWGHEMFIDRDPSLPCRHSRFVPDFPVLKVIQLISYGQKMMRNVTADVSSGIFVRHNTKNSNFLSYRFFILFDLASSIKSFSFQFNGNYTDSLIITNIYRQAKRINFSKFNFFLNISKPKPKPIPSIPRVLVVVHVYKEQTITLIKNRSRHMT